MSDPTPPRRPDEVPVDATLRAYLVGGQTSSSAAELWRSFKVGKIESGVSLGEMFATPPAGYRRSRHGFIRVYCQL